MSRLLEFLRRERLYLLLLAFILAVNAMVMVPAGGKSKARKSEATAVKASTTPQGAAKEAAKQTEAQRRAYIEKMFSENRDLALVFSLASLLIVSVLLLGLAIDVLLTARKLKKRRLDISTYQLQAVNWGAWDVFKVMILFLFFGYIFIMVESALVRVFPLIKDDNFRMILNSSVLDTLGVVLILYFALHERGEKLIALGISVKNFKKNIFYGIVGYLAIIPILIGVLAAIAVIANIMKYIPEKQPVVELFLKEKSAPFLIYTSIFAAIFGPVIEELFFRGFMYNAFKKSFGMFWAMLITAATFAALHAHAVGFLPIMVLGILLVYLYEKTGTLVSSITVHMAHNLSMVFLVFLVKQLGIG